MKEYYLWVELEYEDGGRLRTYLTFNSMEERAKYIKEHDSIISDMEFSESVEEE